MRRKDVPPHPQKQTSQKRESISAEGTSRLMHCPAEIVAFTFKSRHEGRRGCSVHPILCEPVGDRGIDRFRGSDVGIASGMIAFLLLGKTPTV